MDTNKRLTSAVDAVEEQTEEILKKRRQLSQEEGSIYSQYILQLQKQLPACWLLWSKDWSYLLKSIDSSSSIDHESELVVELVSLCRWFLSTDAPETYKDGAYKALNRLPPGTSQMSIDHQSLSLTLESLLDSKHDLVVQQTCSAIAFLCWCRQCNYFKSLSFSDGVLNKLFNLAEQDEPLLPILPSHARRAVCSIACVVESVKEKMIMKAMGGVSVKWPFVYGDAEQVVHTCMNVACIVGTEQDDATRVKIEGVLIPPMVDLIREAQVADDIPVMVAAAFAISSAAEWATHEQIDKLFDMGCLEVLCNNLCIQSHPLTRNSLEGIDRILDAGHEQGHKKYVDWIVNDENSPGWVVFNDVSDEYLSLPCFIHEAYSSIEYRALLIAFIYGGCGWINRLTGQLYMDRD